MKTKTQFMNRILSLVLSIMMVVSMLPASALSVFAAEGDVVSVTIGGETTYYTSIKDAVAKANESGNATITLLQDTTTGERLDITNSATLDLNGNTLSCTAYFADDYETMVAITTNNTKLTIIDSVGGGKLDGTGTDYALMLGEPGAYTARSASAYIDGSTISGSVKTVSGTSMTVSGSTVESNSVVATIDMTNETTLNVLNSQILNTHSSSAASAIDNSGTLTITDSTVSGSIGVDNRGTANISGNTNITSTVCSVKSWVESQDSTLTITGGSYTGGIEISGGTATISGGSYTGGIVVSGGTATISDGTITESRSNKENAVEVSGSADLTISGGTFSAIAGETYDTSVYVHDGGTVKIIGGTITSRAYGVYNDGGSATITGGTISGGTVDLQVVGSDSILNLTLDEGKTVGAAFPDGITVEGSTLAELLSTDTATYWGVVDGKDTMLTVADDATSITDKGDITIRTICDHKDVKLDYITTETTHTPVCSVCNWTGEATEHTGGTATCQNPAVCEACGVSYGDKDANIHTPTEGTIFTDNGDGTHSYTCSSCGNPFTERHTFTDGACTGCGVIGGYCGEEGNEQNVIWTYANGTLTISGTGAMADQFDNYNNRPWEEYVDQITTIVVNDGITSIGEAAFWRFQKLTTAMLPDSLTTISQQAFYGCTALKTVNFPANLKTIDGWAFLGCALESVTLSEGLTTIGYRAFSECKNLTSVTVPASVTTIDEGAFGYSPAKITVAEDNLNYSSDEHGVLFDKDKTTLIYCRPNIEVETYTIPSTVTEICKEAFYGCKNLATITIPDGVQKIGSSAFGGCEALTTITIPAGVTTIEANIFYHCTALTAVTIPAGVTTIDMWAFSGCTALTTVTIPASVTSIAYNAFSNCSALTIVNVPCTWDGSLYTFDESVTLNKVHNWVDGTCTACGAPCDHKDSTHTTSNNNGDGTHSFTCSVCVNTVIEAHTGGTATCTEQAKCEHCGASYGDFAVHSMDYVVDEEANTITYRCGTCDTKTVTFTLVIPTGVVYGSSAMAVPHYDCSDKTYQGDSPEITLDGALLKDFVPGAKTYEVVMTWGGKTVSEEYTIAKAEVSITAAPTPNTLTYIGEAQYLISAGEANVGTMVYSLTENGDYTTSIPQGTNAGDYTVWYYVQGDANYNDSAKDSVAVTIEKVTGKVSNLNISGKTYDGTAVTVPTFDKLGDGAATIEYKVKGADDSTYTTTAPKDAGDYVVRVTVAESENYKVASATAEFTIDKAAITVTIQNATSVYGDTLAELKATDNGIVNGDANVYSLATTATSTSNVGKYAITGTALDSNYDVTFVNGEYEITKREITITVDAKNTVVNTTLPTYTYKVEGLVGVDTLVTEPTLTCNANIALIGEYDITASGADAGGNYSIKYVPAKLTVLNDNAVDAAAGYTEELKDYDPATVTSEDKAELDEMLSEINTILADETTTDNGKKALEEVKEQVEKLIKEITDAAEATDTENTEMVENVTPENVTPENKTDLEGAKADLEKALEDNGGNYTEDEKKAIEDEIKRIDDALEVIGNVEAVAEVIYKLPAVDTVKPDDEEAIKAITDAQTAYNALSDYEKSLVDEATKAALDKLAAALVAYDIVEGDDSSWTEDSDHNITFVVNGLFSKFVGIKVDGKDVDKANYEVKAGSTIITLKASYLDTLAVGEHTISVVYTDGSTDGAFNVHAKANFPATGDNSNMFLWVALLFINGGAVITLTVVDRKKRVATKR